MNSSSYFSLAERKSNFGTEVLAGVSTYLSLAYIFVVNPAILHQAGMDVSAVLFATAMASGLTTLAMGFIARLPFAVAPGLEMNGFFAIFVVGALKFSWQDALGAVFWSGVLYFILAAVPIRQRIIDAIPRGLKINVAVSVGVFVATIGLHLAGIILFKENGMPDLAHFQIASLASSKALVLYTGLAISLLLGLKRFEFPGRMLLGIFVSAVICKVLGIAVAIPAHLSSEMSKGLLQLHVFTVLQNPLFYPVVLTFLIINFFGDITKIIGLTATYPTLQVDGKVPNIEKALYVNSAGTTLGSLIGTSNLITYVENAVGLAAGGRTGISAIVCGSLMLISIVFTPLVGLVPVEATAGILLYVGYLLVPRHQFRSSPDLGRFDWVIAGAMAACSFVFFDLNKAMAIGFAAYFIRSCFVGKKVDPYFAAATLVLITSIVVRYVWTSS